MKTQIKYKILIKMGEKMVKMLNAETKIGLTFGQIIGGLILFASILSGYSDVKTDIAKLQQKNVELELRISKSEANVEIIRQENRDDHKELGKKIDEIILLLNKK